MRAIVLVCVFVCGCVCGFAVGECVCVLLVCVFCEMGLHPGKVLDNKDFYGKLNILTLV